MADEEDDGALVFEEGTKGNAKARFGNYGERGCVGELGRGRQGELAVGFHFLSRRRCLRLRLRFLKCSPRCSRRTTGLSDGKVGCRGRCRYRSRGDGHVFGWVGDGRNEEREGDVGVVGVRIE